MAELNVVLADGYDREVFSRVHARHAALRTVHERMARVLPQAQAMLQDIFCLLFKLTTVVRPAAELSPSSLINRRILESIRNSPGLESLRRRTELDETSAAVATSALADRVLTALKQAFRDEPRDLVDALESAHDEEQLEDRRSQLAHLERTEDFEDGIRQTLADELADEIDELESRVARHRRRQSKAARLVRAIDEPVSTEIDQLPERLDEADTLAGAFVSGEPGSVGAERRLQLGERVMRSRNLKRLARLVGAFREVAFESRRRRVVQAPQETHSVVLGAELEHILPSELLGLRAHLRGGAGRGLRVEFLRRLAEQQLAQYRLEAASSRGPMVVCLDGSGSMQGAKELWGKAVALTFMEIARRERRRCLSIIFSSGHPLFELELLAKRGFGSRATVLTDDVLRFAEHFPGGGTDFEPPLTRALEAVCAGDYRRGDVVFITDGHAEVSETLVQRIAAERRRHRFKIRAILVDVGDHEAREVERFADDVRRVRELTADSLADMFAAV